MSLILTKQNSDDPPMELKNIFEFIPEHLEEEICEVLVQSDHVTIERIISKGHRSSESGWYDQEQNEWVIVLKGKAIISFENGKEITLKAGSHFNISAHQKHKVYWTDPKTETIWLAIYY